MKPQVRGKILYLHLWLPECCAFTYNGNMSPERVLTVSRKISGRKCCGQIPNQQNSCHNIKPFSLPFWNHFMVYKQTWQLKTAGKTNKQTNFLKGISSIILLPRLYCPTHSPCPGEITALSIPFYPGKLWIYDPTKDHRVSRTLDRFKMDSNPGTPIESKSQ